MLRIVVDLIAGFIESAWLMRKKNPRLLHSQLRMAGVAQTHRSRTHVRRPPPRF
jgi:hypothetical protein